MRTGGGVGGRPCLVGSVAGSDANDSRSSSSLMLPPFISSRVGKKSIKIGHIDIANKSHFEG